EVETAGGLERMEHPNRRCLYCRKQNRLSCVDIGVSGHSNGRWVNNKFRECEGLVLDRALKSEGTKSKKVRYKTMKTTFTMIFGLFIVLLSVGTSISNGDFPYISDAKYFADFVISSSIGPCPGVPDRQNPMNALEYTNTGANANLYFFSMGKSSGEIVVKFVCPIINGDGPDLEIIEDTWTGGYQIETADVYAKAKLEDEWTKLGSASNFNGNNGPQAINKFELILDCAQYIRVVDTTFAPSTCSGFDGFDLNSIGSLQPNENCDQCICEKSFSIPLLAGQTIDIGTINITETDGEICVTYSTTGDWWITQIHLAIENNFDAFILNKNDNPKIGQFEFS
ncbi:MAG TPA: hypothetical protein PLH86_13040, partial [Saprospiraceae bacterium]|nr:hypothetical protein [Saprospiraceae bacterium]